jgi:hypothetical protein
VKARTVLVTGAGGSPATNYVRSLRKSSMVFRIIGIDSNKYSLERAETDERYLVPKADDKNYIPIVQQIVKETKPEFMHVQHSNEMVVVSLNRNELGVRTFLPKHESVEICDSKFKSFCVWKRANIKVANTMLLNTEDDIDVAFRRFGQKIWLRAIVGSGGKGACPATDSSWAKLWVTEHNGWGTFTASECLEAESVTWQSIWKDGNLIVAQGRKRLYWELGNRAMSGVTGITGAAVLVSDSVVDKVAQDSILAIDSKPDGIWGVDMTYDNQGYPNPTEINIGRFFTTHQFFTEAGLNMAYIYTMIGLGREVDIRGFVSKLPTDYVWIRGVDFYPKLTTITAVNKHEEQLETRIKRLA